MIITWINTLRLKNDIPLKNKYYEESFIYIWHETLHLYLGNGDKSHVLIELATDNELRFRLNETNEDYSVGYEWLNNIKKDILPKWKDYMAQYPRNILALENKILKE